VAPSLRLGPSSPPDHTEHASSSPGPGVRVTPLALAGPQARRPLDSDPSPGPAGWPSAGIMSPPGRAGAARPASLRLSAAGAASLSHRRRLPVAESLPLPGCAQAAARAASLMIRDLRGRAAGPGRRSDGRTWTVTAHGVTDSVEQRPPLSLGLVTMIIGASESRSDSEPESRSAAQAPACGRGRQARRLRPPNRTPTVNAARRAAALAAASRALPRPVTRAGLSLSRWSRRPSLWPGASEIQDS
jgi:hypothetical protein